MQKTKLGISVGLLGAAIYFMGLFSGYLVVTLLVGYVLLFEENKWLRKAAVKAIALMIFFSCLVAVLNLIPDAIGMVNNILAVFKGSFTMVFVSRVITAATAIINFIEKVMFLILGFKALNQGTIVVPAVEKLIQKNME